jgi:hypothetical protein
MLIADLPSFVMFEYPSTDSSFFGTAVCYPQAFMQLAGFYDSCGQVRPLLLSTVCASPQCVAGSALRIINRLHTATKCFILSCPIIVRRAGGDR